MNPEQFRRWRKHLGWSQAKAAELLGVGVTTIRHYESGHRSDAGHTPAPIPKTTELACAALALGITKYEGPDKKPAHCA